MAALNATNPTLLDFAKRQDPNGSIADVVELLNETNECLPDVSFVEGNLPTGHRTTVRTGIPSPTWRKLYGGVQPTKSTTAQITDNTGMMEMYAEVDAALAQLNGNSAAWRLSEERAFLEGLNQEFVNTLFYGNEGTQPEAFTGLSPRYNSSTAANADNLILADGAGTDNASIWLVVWGPNTIHGIIPKGSKAGIQVTDKGQVTIEDADGSGGRMEALRTHYRWDVGLTVRDWRYAVRIANIDKSLLTKDAATGSDLADLMFRAMNQIPNLSMGRPVWYMSRSIRTMLGRQTANLTKNSTLETNMVGGKMVSSFHEIPIRRCDALSADETLVA